MFKIIRSAVLSVATLFAAHVSGYEYSASGYVTGLAYSTSANDFNNNDTSDGVVDLQAGVLLGLPLPFKTALRWLITNDNLVDYAFLELPSREYRTNYGLRIGRVNRLSGLFSGNGVSYDKMIFLPNGTSPKRLARTLFRFDGAQVFYDRSFGISSNFTADFSYGNMVIEDMGGVFDPAFHTIFPAKDTVIDTNKPLWILAMRLQHGNFELFADYVYIDLRIESTLYGQPVVTEHLPSETAKLGFIYSFGGHELGIEYLWSKGTVPDGGGLGGIAYGWTVMARSIVSNGVSAYYGITQFNPDFTNNSIEQVGMTAPDYIDYGKGFFAGINYDATQNWQFTTELQRNTGAAFLSSTYQDVKTIHKDWWVGSVAVTYRF